LAGKEVAPANLALASPLAEQAAAMKALVFRDELAGQEAGAEVLPEMNRLNADVAAPLLAEGRLFGLIVLGPKRSGSPYFTDDADLLQTLAHQSAVAIRNAQTHQRVVQMNEELQKILSTIESGVIAVGPRGKIVLFNRAAQIVRPSGTLRLRLMDNAATRQVFQLLEHFQIDHVAGRLGDHADEAAAADRLQRAFQPLVEIDRISAPWFQQCRAGERERVNAARREFVAHDLYSHFLIDHRGSRPAKASRWPSPLRPFSRRRWSAGTWSRRTAAPRRCGSGQPPRSCGRIWRWRRSISNAKSLTTPTIDCWKPSNSCSSVARTWITCGESPFSPTCG
jgi:hypothetical protein